MLSRRALICYWLRASARRDRAAVLLAERRCCAGRAVLTRGEGLAGGPVLPQSPAPHHRTVTPSPGVQCWPHVLTVDHGLLLQLAGNVSAARPARPAPRQHHRPRLPRLLSLLPVPRPPGPELQPPAVRGLHTRVRAARLARRLPTLELSVPRLPRLRLVRGAAGGPRLPAHHRAGAALAPQPGRPRVPPRQPGAARARLPIARAGTRLRRPVQAASLPAAVQD